MVGSIGLFLLGALGALLTVYLAKQEVIPEFRAIYDTSDDEIEVSRRQEHIKKTEKDIDDIQAKLREASVPDGLARRLDKVLQSSLTEVRDERTRLEILQRRVNRTIKYSRSLGFIIYIGLGGAIAFLLAGRIKVEGLSGDLPKYFQAIVIGATWTSYLSAIGFRSGQKKAEDRIEAAKKQASENIEALKQELAPKVAEMVASAEKINKVRTPALAGEVQIMMMEKIDRTNNALQKKLDETKKMVKRDVKGIL